ncbi:MAG: hypothetical protein ACI959_001253, partial [Limisphaerales bacterium]
KIVDCTFGKRLDWAKLEIESDRIKINIINTGKINLFINLRLN